MTEMSREHLFHVVREVYAAHDPMPVGLIERMQEVVAAEESGLGLDFELMLLVEESTELAGTRGETDTEEELLIPGQRAGERGIPGPPRRAGAAPYTLRFVLGEVDLLVRVAPDGEGHTSRIDGWVVPPEAMTVRALPTEHEQPSRATVIGDSGRFEFTDLEPGLIRLQFEAHDGSRPPFATPAFEI